MSPEPGLPSVASNSPENPFPSVTKSGTWDEIAAGQCGVISVADAMRTGLTWSEIRWRLSTGRWQRPMKRVVVTHSGPLAHEATLWCAIESIGPPAYLAGATAAALLGLRDVPTEHLDVVVPACRRPGPRPGVRIHRSRVFGPVDVYGSRTPPRTTLERAVIDVTSWAKTDDDARAVVAAAVQQRLTTPDRLRVVLTRVGHRRRYGLVAQTLDDVAGGAHSLAELDYRRIERRYELPTGLFQAPVTIAGRKRYLDVWYEPWAVWVEIDGSHHSEARQWWDDLDRQNGGVLDGRLVLRFPAHVVREQPEKVAAQVRQALRSRGWSGAATS